MKSKFLKAKFVVPAVALVIVIAAASGGGKDKDKSKTQDAAQNVKAPATSSAPSTPATSAAPDPAADTKKAKGLGSGTLIVGTDIQPGTYKATTADKHGYWERQKDTTGDMDSILANDSVEPHEQAVVTILATDKAFKSSGFDGWVKADGPSTTGGELGSGTLIVGTDIQPGTYKATVTGGHGYWERQKDTTGGMDSIAANDNADTGEQAVVTITSADKAFKSSGFGAWVKTS